MKKAIPLLLLLSLPTLAAPTNAPTGTFLCNPNLTRWTGTNAAHVLSRSVMTIFPYRDRLYVSGGEWNANTGPCPVFAVDPETGAFTNEFSAGTETVWYFRPASDGSLYVPGVDIKEGSKTRGPLFRRDPDGVWTNLSIVPKGEIKELGGEGYSMHTWDAVCWKGKVFTAGYGIGVGDEGSSEKMREGTPGLTDARIRYGSVKLTNGEERVVQVYRRFYSFLPFRDALFCFTGCLNRTNVNPRLALEQWTYNEKSGIFDCVTNSLDRVCPGYRMPTFTVFWHATPVGDRVLFIAGPESQRCPPGFLYSAIHTNGLVQSERIKLEEEVVPVVITNRVALSGKTAPDGKPLPVGMSNGVARLEAPVLEGKPLADGSTNDVAQTKTIFVTKRFAPVCISSYEGKVGVLATMRTKDGIRNGIWETKDGIDFQKVLEFRTEHAPSAFTWYKGCYYYAIGAGRFNFARVGKESGAIYKLDPSSTKAVH